MEEKTSTNRTILSHKKVSLLLEGLVDLDTQKGLPEDVEVLVTNFLNSKNEFIRGIDKFMHRKKWEVEEEKTVKTIINICPEFLHTKDDDGNIPIHCTATHLSSHDSMKLYFPLLAEVGYNDGVGGKDGRGGILVQNDTGTFALRRCTMYDKSNHEVIRALMNIDPPLFSKEDVSKYKLVRGNVLWPSNLEAIKFYVEMSPSSLFEQDHLGGTPLSCAYFINIAQYLLRRALQHDSKHKSIGGLFPQGNSGKTKIFEGMEERFGIEEAWDMIEKEVSLYKDLPILHRTIQYAPEKINQVMNRFPHSLFVRDERNRLPIHLALEKGLKWSTELVAIMNANMLHLNEKDPATGYYPFALAAEGRSDLRTINHLLRMHPDQIEAGICNKSATHELKRRKVE